MPLSDLAPVLPYRTSPACSTPSTRWWTPRSTTLLATARLCGSSSLLLQTQASGGGAVLRVPQVSVTLTQCGAAAEKKGASGVPSVDLCWQLTQRLVCCHAERRSLQACQSFVSLQFLHRSIPPTQWGSFLMMGGDCVERETGRERPLPSLAAFKYPKRNLKRCAKSFW